MSYDDFDEDEQNAGPKALRDHAKKLEKQLEELAKKLEAAEQARTEAEKKAKASTLRDVLTGLKIDPKFARLAERDGVEPEADAVKKWVDENKDFYSFTPTQAEQADEVADEVYEESEDDIDPNYRQAVEAGNRAGAQGAGMGSSSVVDQIANLSAGSFEELVAELEKLGAPTV